MATTTETRTVKTLKSQINNQKEQITKLLNRMNRMSDEIHTLKNDLGRFKKNVADDVKYLTDRVDD